MAAIHSHKPATIVRHFPKTHAGPTSNPSLLKIASAVLSFFAVKTAAYDCPMPSGSYTNSCVVPYKGEPYTHPDQNLRGIPFCKYTIGCSTAASRGTFAYHEVTVILPLSEASKAIWENCDGHVVSSPDATQSCTTADGIRRVLEERSLPASFPFNDTRTI